MKKDSVRVTGAKKRTTGTTNHDRRYVLVTDARRGVYFGAVKSIDGSTIKLTKARHCYSYVVSGHVDKSARGVYALAAIGPQAGSRVGPVVSMTVFDVATITECSAVAIAAWMAAIWA